MEVIKARLKVIKVRYEGNRCASCNRLMNVGWDAYYRAEPKKELFCLPCGQKILGLEDIEREKVKSDEEEKFVSYNECIISILQDMSDKLTDIVSRLEKSGKMDNKKEKNAKKSK